jgi:ribosomal protein S18 acetylase RimI-like enzyme
MEVIIREMDESNLQDTNLCNSTFIVDSRLALRYEDGDITWSIDPIKPREKSYPPDEVDLTAYLHHPDRTFFFAYVGHQLAGQIQLRTWWNHFASIEDIRVEPGFRKQGIGRALVEQAIIWARGKGMPGIRLETQDVNVPACRLYERCGFKLGGFDWYLYRDFKGCEGEIALYWYRVFEY